MASWLTRRRLLQGVTALAAVDVVAPSTARSGLSRVGVISLGSAPVASGPGTIDTIIRRRLAQLGWIEGTNVSVEFRFVSDGADMSKEIEQILALKVDVIVALGTPLVVAVRKLTNSIPVVFSVSLDPVQYGLIQSLARPDRNLTGIYTPTAEHAGKRLALLHEAVPSSSRIAVLKFENALSAIESSLTESAAERLGVELVPTVVKRIDDFDAAFSSMKKAGATSLTLLTDARTRNNFGRLAGLAIANALPSIAGYPGYAPRGGLMAYGASGVEGVRRTADFVAKILHGTPPADLPVEQSMRYVLSLNSRTARKLGMSFPGSLLRYADVVLT